MSNNLGSTRQAAGEAILELARAGKDVVAVTADTSKSMYTTLIREEFKDRFIDTGIAEQSMMMTAAGLAAAGKTAFAASYSVFTSMKCCEQLRTFIAYPNLNVKVIAGLGGLSAGIEGVTHIATEDLGIMRCIANMVVLAPSDFITTKKAVIAAADHSGPVYIRVGRDPSPILFDENYDFVIGKPVLHRSGSDVTICASGLILAEAIKAADILKDRGIDAGLIEVHTIKPVLYQDILINEALKTKKIITVEEHNIIGGLGTVISELLCGRGELCIKKLGLKDQFAESGTPEELYRLFNLNAEAIAEEAKKMMT